MTYTYKFTHSNLASRSLGAKVRNNILDSKEKVFLDFSKVETISASCADEIFGVLFLAKGYSWIVDNIKVKHANDYVLTSIATAIDYRKFESQSAA